MSAKTFARITEDCPNVVQFNDYLRGSDALTEWTRKYNLLGHLAPTKTLGRFAHVRKEQVAVLLGALWLTDGYVDPDASEISYSTASKALAVEVRDLLLRIGVIATLHTKIIDERPYYNVRLLGSSRRRFIATVTVEGPKGERLAAAKDRRHAHESSADVLPFEVWSPHLPKRVGNAWWSGRRGMSREQFVKFGGDARVSEEEVAWLPVDAIEELGSMPCYDLTVDSREHAYIADGFVVHNSSLLELLACALYRRCPTRGLLGALATSRNSALEVRLVNGAAHTIRHAVDAVSGDGESSVVDANGNACLKSGGRREFDAWALRHLPSPEVFYAAQFGVQGAGGVVDMTDGERKAVVLRVRGIERYEALAEDARRRARAAESALKIAEARLADERARGVALEDAEQASEMAQKVLTSAMRLEAEADAALRGAKAAVEAWEAANAEHQRVAGVRSRLEEVRRRLDGHARERARIEALGANEEALRAAASESEALTAQAGQIRLELARAEADERAARAEIEAARAEAVRRGRELDAKERQLVDAVNAAHRAAADAAKVVVAAEGRIAAQAGLVGQAEAIRSAKKTYDDAAARKAELATGKAVAEAEVVRVLAEQRQAKGLADAAAERETRAHARVWAAEAKIARADEVTRAIVQRDRLTAEVEALEEECRVRASHLEDLRRAELTSTTSRIVDLREVLATIALDGDPELASPGLEADDQAAELEKARPGAIALAIRINDEKVAALARCRALLADVQPVAARQAEIDAARVEKASAEEEIARETAANDAAALALQKLLADERAGRDLVASIAKEHEAASWRWAEARPLAIQEGALVRAEASLEGLHREIDGAKASRAAADAALVAAQEARAGFCRDTDEDLVRIETQGEKARARAHTAKIGAVATSESLGTVTGCIAGRAPKLRELAALEAARATLPAIDEAHAMETRAARELAQGLPPVEPPDPGPKPRLDVVAQVLDAARAEREAARQAHAAATATLVLAVERAARIEALEAEQCALLDELTDWTALGEDLGRDGLQALEIDAACPELTDLTNELLRTCYGPRFVVTIQASRLSAKGEEADGFAFDVLDTEPTGGGPARSADAKTFSGGEKVILNKAIGGALTIMGCAALDVQDPTLIEDETGAALSEAAGEAFIRMLRLVGERVGASKTLFVSHNPALWGMADARVVLAGGGIEVVS